MLTYVIGWHELWDRRGLRIAMMGLGALLVLSGVGAGGYYLRAEPAPKPPPPARTASVEEAQGYVASDDFERLPMDDRIAWVDQRMQRMAEMDDDEFRQSWETMDEQTRRRIRENLMPVMQARMKRDVDGYHELPESERDAFLDERIDDMERFRKRGRRMLGGPPGQGSPSPPGQAPGPGNGRGGPGRMGGRMMANMAKLPADRRAKMMSFMKAMARRRTERGMPPPFGRPR